MISSYLFMYITNIAYTFILVNTQVLSDTQENSYPISHENLTKTSQRARCPML